MSSHRFSVSALLPKKLLNATYMPWIVWGLACTFYFYEFLLQVSLGVMSNELMRDFDITSQTLGLLAGIYFYSYAFMQLPCGLMIDKYGPHMLLTLSTAICAFSTIIFGITDNFIIVCISRLLIGISSAFAAIGCLKLAANWFAPQRFALLTGLMLTVGMLGAMGGEAPLAWLINRNGWRESMFLMGCIGLVLTILILVVIRDVPPNHKPITPTHSTDETGTLHNLRTMFSNKQLWLIALYGGLMYMPTPIFCGLWGVPFLMGKMGIPKTTAAHLVSMIFLGWAIASPFWGIYSTKIGLRKPSLYIGAVGSLITSLLFLYIPGIPTYLMGLLLLTFGIFSSAFLPSYAMIREVSSKHAVATSLSFMNMMNMLGIALFQPIIGYFLDKTWKGDFFHNVRYYDLHSWQLALSIIPLGIIVALSLLPFIKETYCQQSEQ